GVVARRDRGETVDPVGARHVVARSLHRRTTDRYGHTRHDCTARIGDFAVDGARCGADGLAGCSGRRSQGDDENQYRNLAMQPPHAPPSIRKNVRPDAEGECRNWTDTTPESESAQSVFMPRIRFAAAAARFWIRLVSPAGHSIYNSTPRSSAQARRRFAAHRADSAKVTFLRG